MDTGTALLQGLHIILEPHRLLILWAGVLCGLALGILPGIGGVAGTALLLPFTYSMDQPAAMALLLGLAATTTHGDPISAIVLGAPGHAASAATALDGYPMTKRGEGARALGAAYMSALLGGLFGAVLMAAVLPIVRPLILYVGSPELLALAVFGLSMVSALSGSAPLRGLTMACFGIMLAMIGSDPQTGTQRWTMDQLYLWEGLPLVPLTLGLFALPELCDLMVARTSVYTSGEATDNWRGLRQGSLDCFRHWWLVLRCSSIGSVIGAIPGISASVIDWISYGHALRTERGAADTFGRGDVRGVIAAESATCSREGGALVPTIVFGVPGSAGMAILLGAFMMHGLVPGPEMLTKNLPTTYAMVWSIAIANVLGSGLCYLFSSQFAKLASLRYTLVLPVVLSLVYIGAFEGHRAWGDLYSLLLFGVLGWAMKHARWPRPPLVLGFILGGIIERYMFISIERYGSTWLLRPAVVILFALAAISLFGPLLRDARARLKRPSEPLVLWAPRLTSAQLFPIALLALFATMLADMGEWTDAARIVPAIVGGGAVAFCTLSLVNSVARGGIPANSDREIHMDLVAATGDLPGRTILARGALFFGWLLAFLASMALIGLIPTVPLFIAMLMRLEGRERWPLVGAVALGTTLLVWIVFDRLLAIPWPGSVLGDAVPWLRQTIPSM